MSHDLLWWQNYSFLIIDELDKPDEPASTETPTEELDFTTIEDTNNNNNDNNNDEIQEDVRVVLQLCCYFK